MKTTKPIGIDIITLRNVVNEMLQSSGGRPRIVGTTESDRIKIPRISQDWEKLNHLAKNFSSTLKYCPTSSQLAAILLHLTLKHITESECEMLISKQRDVSKEEKEITYKGQ